MTFRFSRWWGLGLAAALCGCQGVPDGTPPPAGAPIVEPAPVMSAGAAMTETEALRRAVAGIASCPATLTAAAPPVTRLETPGVVPASVLYRRLIADGVIRVGGGEAEYALSVRLAPHGEVARWRVELVRSADREVVWRDDFSIFAAK